MTAFENGHFVTGPENGSRKRSSTRICRLLRKSQLISADESPKRRMETSKQNGGREGRRNDVRRRNYQPEDENEEEEDEREEEVRKK